MDIALFVICWTHSEAGLFFYRQLQLILILRAKICSCWWFLGAVSGEPLCMLHFLSN